jgi:hypothetical protein
VVAQWVGEIGTWEEKEAAGGRKKHGREKMKQVAGEKVTGGKFLPRVDDNGGPPLQATLFVLSNAPYVAGMGSGPLTPYWDALDQKRLWSVRLGTRLEKLLGGHWHLSVICYTNYKQKSYMPAIAAREARTTDPASHWANTFSLFHCFYVTSLLFLFSFHIFLFQFAFLVFLSFF